MNNDLNPQLTSSFDQIWGSKTPAAGAPLSSRANEIRALGKTATAPVDTSSDPILTLSKDVADSATGGINKFGQGFKQTQDAAKSGDLGTMGRGILNEAGGGLETVFSPISGALNSASKIPGISNMVDAVKKYVINPASDKISNAKPLQDFMMKYPNADEVVGNLITVIGSLVGGKEAPEIKGAINDAVDTGVNAIKPVTNAVADTVSGATEGIKNKATDMAVNSEKAGWQKPTTVPKAAYNKATGVFDSAASQGHDIPTTLVNNGLKLSDHVETNPGGSGKVYNTADTAEQMHADAAKTSNEMLRPSLEKADASGAVPKTPVKDVIQSSIDNINSDKSITAETKTSIIEKLNTTRAALESKYPEGMSLTNLHDEKIVRDANAKYSPVGDIATNAEAIKNKAIADATRKMVEDKAPSDIPVKEFNAELTKQHQAANYLKELHGKKVPQSIISKIAQTGAKVAGAAFGHGVGGGIFGSVGGYHIGGMVESMIEGLPNPLRNSLLDNLKTINPEAFKAVSDYLSKEVPKVPETPLNLPEIPAKNTQEMNMGSYKLGKNPTTGVVEPTGQYRKPGVNFYPKK